MSPANVYIEFKFPYNCNKAKAIMTSMPFNYHNIIKAKCTCGQSAAISFTLIKNPTRIFENLGKQKKNEYKQIIYLCKVQKTWKVTITERKQHNI